MHSCACRIAPRSLDPAVEAGLLQLGLCLQQCGDRHQRIIQRGTRRTTRAVRRGCLNHANTHLPWCSNAAPNCANAASASSASTPKTLSAACIRAQRSHALTGKGRPRAHACVSARYPPKANPSGASPPRHVCTCTQHAAQHEACSRCNIRAMRHAGNSVQRAARRDRSRLAFAVLRATRRVQARCESSAHARLRALRGAPQAPASRPLHTA